MSGPRHETLLGLDNVALDLPVAAFPMRILAACVDYLLFLVVLLVTIIGGGMWASWLGIRSAWLLAAGLLAYFVLEYGYFVGLEILMGGQTPGKRLFGLRVTTSHGGQASPGAILIRNAIRSIDIAIGLPFMILHPLGQRLGDRLAGTLVLQTAPASTDSIVRRVPPEWSVREINVAEEFLRRSVSMDPIEARRLARRLLEKLEQQSPGFVSQHHRDPVDTLRGALGATEP